MKKRPPSSQTATASVGALVELERRLSLLEEWANGSAGYRLDLSELRRALEAEHQLALEAIAQAQDALATARPLEQQLHTLTMAVAHGIEHVDRAERRIAATVGRARAQLRESGLESPGLEAEARDLHELDGARGEGRPVPPVPAQVEPAEEEDQLMRNLRALRLSR